MCAEHNKYCAAAWFARNTAAQLQPLKQISVSPAGLEKNQKLPRIMSKISSKTKN